MAAVTWSPRRKYFIVAKLPSRNSLCMSVWPCSETGTPLCCSPWKFRQSISKEFITQKLMTANRESSERANRPTERFWLASVLHDLFEIHLWALALLQNSRGKTIGFIENYYYYCRNSLSDLLDRSLISQGFHTELLVSVPQETVITKAQFALAPSGSFLLVYIGFSMHLNGTWETHRERSCSVWKTMEVENSSDSSTASRIRQRNSKGSLLLSVLILRF